MSDSESTTTSAVGAVADEDLTEDEFIFLNYLEQCWYADGSVPTTAALGAVGVPEDFVLGCYRKAKFREQLTARGISIKGLPAVDGDVPLTRWKQLMLTEEQLTVANVMLDLNDTRSQKKKLSDLGVSTQLYQSWLRDPVFQGYLRTRAENLLTDHQHDAHTALIDRMKTGDISAIKYYNEITGRYVPSATANVDVALVLMRVIEIIQQVVTDSAQQEAIANKLLELSEPSNLTGVSPVKPSIVEGEVVKRSTPEPFKIEAI